MTKVKCFKCGKTAVIGGLLSDGWTIGRMWSGERTPEEIKLLKYFSICPDCSPDESKIKMTRHHFRHADTKKVLAEMELED